MPNLISTLFLLLVGASQANAATYALQKICEKSPVKRLPQFESNKKSVIKTTALLKTAADKNKFQTSDMYQWARFATPETLGILLLPADKDMCAKKYQSFLAEKDEKKSIEGAELWRACLNSDYRDSIPPMAKNLLKCHGLKSTEDILDGDAIAPKEPAE